MKHIKKFKLFENEAGMPSYPEESFFTDDKENKISELKNKIEVQKNSMSKYPSRNKFEMIERWKKELRELEKSEVSEGTTFKDTKKLYPKKVWDNDKKVDFKIQIRNHVKSKQLETKEVGNDLEIILHDDVIAQVMFRNDYVGVKEKGAKFVDEFEYTELGKIKSTISNIIKKCKKFESLNTIDKSELKKKIIDHVKSQQFDFKPMLETRESESGLEVIGGDDIIARVNLYEDHVGIQDLQPHGLKSEEEFEYSDIRGIKASISDIIRFFLKMGL